MQICYGLILVAFFVGIHTDTNGNVYSGVGDGVGVWNPSGELIGKFAVANGGGKHFPQSEWSSRADDDLRW